MNQTSAGWQIRELVSNTVTECTNDRQLGTAVVILERIPKGKRRVLIAEFDLPPGFEPAGVGAYSPSRDDMEVVCAARTRIEVIDE